MKEPHCAILPSPLGPLTLYATDEALIALLFENEKPGERVEIQGLSENAPPNLTNPQPHNPTAILQESLRQLAEYFAGTRRDFDLPIAQPGTDFRQRVWAELCRIPFGKTISYLELARRLGDEKCIRAAGSANGKNALSIIVPCHRVIGSNGDLIGYGGQLWRKKWLLEHEQKFAHGVQRLF